MQPIEEILNKHQLRNDSSSLNKTFVNQLSIDVVDKLAEELVTEYNNSPYRRWYCGVIYDFGPAQVHEWRVKASEGNQPAKLFSKYVKNSRTHRGSQRSFHGQPK